MNVCTFMYMYVCSTDRYTCTPVLYIHTSQTVHTVHVCVVYTTHVHVHLYLFI